MAANTTLRVTELDFDEITSNLKAFLKTQEQFKDYDFDGSVISTLIRVLAYNTHYNGVYVNMLGNEMFLDTAQQRDSIVSRAKELGYTPTSSYGPTANIQLSFTGISNTVSQFTIPKNTTFISRIDNTNYTFSTTESKSVVKTDGVFKTNLLIKEGYPLTHKFNVVDVDTDRFIIPNTGVDTSSLFVRVQESSSDTTTTEFTKATTLQQITSSSPVYFLEESSDEKFELIFGKGTLGKSLKAGNVVIVDYLVCNGDATNGANTFNVGTMNVGVPYTSVSIGINTVARGGREIEDVGSIKFNAPRSYQTQNRAIVASDYERILLEENPDLQSVIAFGGELADPAVYGKVYVAVKPFGEEYVTENRKAQIKASIEDRTPLSVDTVLIDPDYTYIIPNITTYYDKAATTSSPGNIEASVRQAITDYSTSFLERFYNRVRYSRFVRSLDNITTGAIINNEAILQIQKRIVPNVDRAEKYSLRFNNRLREGTISTTEFTYKNFTCYLDDNKGVIRIYRYNSDKQKVVVESNIGTINYTTGIMVLNNFNPSSYAGIQMKITAAPYNLDIIPIREQILIMNSTDAVITVIAE